MTVLGPVAGGELGVTLLHEHLIADDTFEDGDPNRRYADAEEMVGECREFVSAGGRTMVELTSRGLGQDVRALRQISEEGGLQIVAATGFYREKVYPEYVRHESADQLAQRMINDYHDGLDDTNIRPGIIAELATEFQAGGMSPNEEKVFRAAARASLATGMAVSTHCWQGELAMEQIRVLTEEGVGPDRVVIGHLGVAHGLLDRVAKIADAGVYLGIDCIGYVLDDWDDADRADMVKALIDRGYLRQITISQDMLRRSFLKCRGGHGYTHILDTFAPMLQERGVTTEEIDTMLVDTPRRVLTGDGGGNSQ
jgi:phosphotriesterase-related protein